jgi:cell division protein FtsA
MKDDNIVVGLDVGTTKICAIVGEILDGEVQIIGMGTAPSYGLRKGVVVNIESTVESIRKAIKEAENTAGVQIGSVVVGIAGGHISSFQSHGVIPVKDTEITQKDIDRVIDAAQAVAIPFDREVLHILPVDYIVDGQDGIKDPRGMHGIRLESKVHIVTGAVTSVQNLVKCCQRQSLDVQDIVLEPLASAEAILTSDEKDLGAGIIDIGGGTTDIALFSGGTIRHSSIIGLGGNNFTHDIAVGLRTPSFDAEKIKVDHGCVLGSILKQDEEIEVTYTGGRPSRMIPRHYLAEILQPRAEELFEIIKMEIRKNNYHHLIASGMVLTGGSSQMAGIAQLAESMLELPVRTGQPFTKGPIKDVVNSPEFSTGVGLVIYGAHEMKKSERFIKGNLFKKIFTRMKSWVSGGVR